MFSVRTVDRMVALLVSLFLVIFSVAFLWQAIGQAAILDRLISYLSQPRWTALFTSLALVVLGMLLFWMGIRRRRQVKMIVSDTPLGEVRVAERAVEVLALRSVRRVKGVHDASVNVRATAEGLDFAIEAAVAPDQSIPQITQELRIRVSEYIRETVGVSVNTVTVNVTKIVAAESRARVE